MRILKLTFLLSSIFLLFSPVSATATVTLERYQMWRTKPPGCDAALAATPAPVTTFLTTDTEAYLWFFVRDAKAGDVAATAYYQPDGQLYAPASGPFNALASDGNYCFTDVAFKIAGNIPANLPGVWRIRGTWNGQEIFTLTFTIQASGGGGLGNCTTMTIDGKANIFASGRATAFDGILPPGCSFAAGPGKIMTFQDVTGGAACLSTTLNGPEGGNCAGGNTNINSYRGIAGIVHSTKTMFLVGVYLDDREPQDPAPARLNFSTNDSYSSLSPLIGQVFFIGDGLTGAGAGARQQVQVPSTATRLFLGIADAYSFQGNPGAYGDNIGSFKATPVFGGGGGQTNCTYSVSPLTQTVPAAGGSVSVSVTATSGCAWTANSFVPWISFPGAASGTGSGTVIFQVQAQTGTAARTGTLNIAGQTFTLVQNGTSGSTCTYSISPTTQNQTAPGGNGSITVTATAGCAWTAASNVSWITITAGSSGTGNGRVDYTVAANAGTPARTGAITVGGQTFTLTQAGVSGGGGTPGCSYFVNPSAQSIAGGGGTGLVLITTASTCAWTATSNASWITITAGSTGTGNGAVSYRAAANPSTTARTGTLTIAGQTHTVTQAGGTTCTYSATPTSASVPASGGTGGFLVSTQSGCAWTVSSSATWVTITAGSTGNGSGNVSFSVAANATTASRTATISAGSAAFTVNQAAGGAPGGPVITSGGIVNAASYTPASLPGGAIAQGSFFSVFGTGLGPKNWVKAEDYPLPANLGGVTIKVVQGSRSVDALPVFVSETQINAVMPSNAPVGDVQVTISFEGKTSSAAKVRVAQNNFGIFTTAGGRGPAIVQNFVSQVDQPLNTLVQGIKPGQVGILWGTGLGPITAPDNQAPPAGDLPFPVQIYVGNKEAKKLYSGRTPCCSGVDQIVFETPPDVPEGCNVPIQVRAGGNWSNVATVAVDGDGTTCSNPHNPFSTMVSEGGKAGNVFLLRGSATVPLEAGKPPTDLLLDAGLASFSEIAAGGVLGYNPLYSLPPVGTCSVFAGELDLGKLLGTDLSNPQSGLTGKPLDAGSVITVTGPGGVRELKHSDEEQGTGPYVGLLGGKIPIGDSPELPLFLNAGTFTVSGRGGRDVGPFSAQLTIANPVNWTNRNQLTSINRSSDLVLTWTGGQANQILLIAGGSQDEPSKGAAGFVCFADAAKGSFAIPASTLANLPPSVPEEAGETPPGTLLMGSLPAGEFPKFTANGLNSGLLFHAYLQLVLVPYR